MSSWIRWGSSQRSKSKSSGVRPGCWIASPATAAFRLESIQADKQKDRNKVYQKHFVPILFLNERKHGKNEELKEICYNLIKRIQITVLNEVEQFSKNKIEHFQAQQKICQAKE